MVPTGLDYERPGAIQMPTDFRSTPSCRWTDADHEQARRMIATPNGEAYASSVMDLAKRFPRALVSYQHLKPAQIDADIRKIVMKEFSSIDHNRFGEFDARLPLNEWLIDRCSRRATKEVPGFPPPECWLSEHELARAPELLVPPISQWLSRTDDEPALTILETLCRSGVDWEHAASALEQWVKRKSARNFRGYRGHKPENLSCPMIPWIVGTLRMTCRCGLGQRVDVSLDPTDEGSAGDPIPQMEEAESFERRATRAMLVELSLKVVFKGKNIERQRRAAIEILEGGPDKDWEDVARNTLSAWIRAEVAHWTSTGVVPKAPERIVRGFKALCGSADDLRPLRPFYEGLMQAFVGGPLSAARDMLRLAFFGAEPYEALLESDDERTRTWGIARLRDLRRAPLGPEWLQGLVARLTDAAVPEAAAVAEAMGTLVLDARREGFLLHDSNTGVSRGWLPPGADAQTAQSRLVEVRRAIEALTERKDAVLTATGCVALGKFGDPRLPRWVQDLTLSEVDQECLRLFWLGPNNVPSHLRLPASPAKVADETRTRSGTIRQRLYRAELHFFEKAQRAAGVLP
jgi:hypothetical protein